MTEREKMLTGKLYDPMDAELQRMREWAREQTGRFNTADPTERGDILRGLFGSMGNEVLIEPPFHCDYGVHIHVGERVFFNFNCVVLDVAEVRIGDNVLFGPAVQIYTATHPLDWEERRKGLELGYPVEIGSNVWVGGGAIICPGVRIGDRSVIGAGSVVTKDIPAGTLAAGNPCRVIRPLV